MLGDLVYLYLIDLENDLAIKQEIIEDRFCKIIEEKTIKGVRKEGYKQYKLQSIYNDKIYTVNNYLSLYKFCNISTLEDTLQNLKDIIYPQRLEAIYEIINKVKA